MARKQISQMKLCIKINKVKKTKTKNLTNTYLTIHVQLCKPLRQKHTVLIQVSRYGSEIYKKSVIHVYPVVRYKFRAMFLQNLCAHLFCSLIKLDAVLHVHKRDQAILTSEPHKKKILTLHFLKSMLEKLGLYNEVTV